MATVVLGVVAAVMALMRKKPISRAASPAWQQTIESDKADVAGAAAITWRKKPQGGSATPLIGIFRNVRGLLDSGVAGHQQQPAQQAGQQDSAPTDSLASRPRSRSMEIRAMSVLVGGGRLGAQAQAGTEGPHPGHRTNDPGRTSRLRAAATPFAPLLPTGA
ncbi:hypothetical protein [Streptomyces griseoluteus]